MAAAAPVSAKLAEALETAKRAVTLFLSKYSVTDRGISYFRTPLDDSFYEIVARAAATKDLTKKEDVNRLESEMMGVYPGTEKGILAGLFALTVGDVYNLSPKVWEIIKSIEKFLKDSGFQVTKKVAAAGGAGGGGARAAAPVAAPAAPPPCTVCGKAAFYRCQKCAEQGLITPYCSVECQSEDWKRGHRFVHNPPHMENVSRKRTRNRKNRKNHRRTRKRTA